MRRGDRESQLVSPSVTTRLRIRLSSGDHCPLLKLACSSATAPLRAGPHSFVSLITWTLPGDLTLAGQPLASFRERRGSTSDQHSAMCRAHAFDCAETGPSRCDPPGKSAPATRHTAAQCVSAWHTCCELGQSVKDSHNATRCVTDCRRTKRASKPHGGGRTRMDHVWGGSTTVSSRSASGGFAA